MKQKYGQEKMQFYKDNYQHNIRDLGSAGSGEQRERSRTAMDPHSKETSNGVNLVGLTSVEENLTRQILMLKEEMDQKLKDISSGMTGLSKETPPT